MKNSKTLNEQLKIELDEIFSKYSKSQNLTSEIANRGHVVCEPEEKDLLCIGINPSYLESDPNKNGYSYKLKDAVNGYAKHYGNFNILAENGLYVDRWGYMDLLALRETDQSKINNLITTKEGLNFITEQLSVSQHLIETLKPKVLFVANSGASLFLGAKQNDNENIWMGYQTHFDENFGVHVIVDVHSKNVGGITSTNLIGVPVIFSSTLTYMDTYSKARLSWMLRRIARNYSSFFGDKYNNLNKVKQLLDQSHDLMKRIESNLNLKKNLHDQERYEELSTVHDAEKRLLNSLNILLDKYRQTKKTN